MRPLSFSTEFLKAYEVEIDGNIVLDKKSIVVNLSNTPVTIVSDNSTFGNHESRLLFPTRIAAEGAKVCVVQIEGDDFLQGSEEISQSVKRSWTLASELFPQVEELKKLVMYKSPKDASNGYELNFWFLQKDSLGRIHRDHDFLEQHTQIIGMGQMQKYQEQNYNSAFEKVYMTPGYTHYPFYSDKGVYPWHSYNAISDCIWMAIEKH